MQFSQILPNFLSPVWEFGANGVTGEWQRRPCWLTDIKIKYVIITKNTQLFLKLIFTQTSFVFFHRWKTVLSMYNVWTSHSESNTCNTKYISSYGSQLNKDIPGRNVCLDFLPPSPSSVGSGKILHQPQSVKST